MAIQWAAESLLSGKSINEARNVLSQIFKRAYYDEVIDTNPVERIERYKQAPSEPKPFTTLEIEKIISALDAPYKQFFQFAFYTGLRTGELLGLRWEDLELDREIAHIRVNITSGIEKAPKTAGSIRTVELHPTLSCFNMLNGLLKRFHRAFAVFDCKFLAPVAVRRH